MNVAVIFTTDGDNVKVSVAVKFIDNQTKACLLYTSDAADD